MNGNGFQPWEKIGGHVEKDKVNINLVISKKVFHTKPLILKGKLAPQGSKEQLPIQLSIQIMVPSPLPMAQPEPFLITAQPFFLTGLGTRATELKSTALN